MGYVLKYKDAQEISQKYNNNNFWEFSFMKDGYKLSSFNYFICGWNDFEAPLPNRPEVNAFDMRGTTFVFNKDGSLWKTFLMLPKFFNINQVESTQYGKIKDKKILNITAKEDGSLVAFMMLPNGKLFSKTIGSFTSEQAEAAYKLLYEDEEQVLWVKNMLNSGYTPLFEYLSWDNRVVVKYAAPHLCLIGVRDNITGAYYAAEELVRNSIPMSMHLAGSYAGDLDYYIELAKTMEGKEGWVVKFTDGQLVKIKTAWYFKLHGLRTQDINREDYVIKNYLEETLDDVMSQLDPSEDADAFAFVKKVTDAKLKDFQKSNLVIIGCPTHGGRSSKAVQVLLNMLPKESLKNTKIAVFDTSVTTYKQNIFMKGIIKFFGYSAPRTADILKKKGAEIVSVQTFFVMGIKGPIKDDELERVKNWSKSLIK